MKRRILAIAITCCAVAADWCHKALDAAAPGDEGAIANANEYLNWIANNS